MILTIGRASDNKIVIIDPTEKVSRYHAKLLLKDDGKISIVDDSSNGTFINGIKILRKIETPIRRGDKVVFANVADLNWQQIPEVKRTLFYKEYKIGSGNENDILIYDLTQKVSRYHADLKADKNGNFFINDHSTNGTYVNGVKIVPNVDYPISKKDTISFANLQTLNWNKIKHPITIASNPIILKIIFVFLLCLILIFSLKFILTVDIAKRYSPSVVLIYHEFIYKVNIQNIEEFYVSKNSDGEFIRYNSGDNGIIITGTGFFVSENGLIITNRHIASPWDYNENIEEIKNILVSKSNYNITKNEINIKPITQFLGIALNNSYINKESDLIECKFYNKSQDPIIDLAAIQTKDKTTPLQVKHIVNVYNVAKNPKSLKLGMNLYMLGFPAGFSLGATENGLKANFQAGQLTREPDSYSIGHNLPTIGGGSGSPIFDKRGHLVAVNYAGLKNTQGFNFAILAKYIEAIVGY